MRGSAFWRHGLCERVLRSAFRSGQRPSLDPDAIGVMLYIMPTRHGVAARTGKHLENDRSLEL
jgi:hypothetical protein